MTNDASVSVRSATRAAFERSARLDRLVPLVWVATLVVPAWFFGARDGKVVLLALVATSIALGTAYLRSDVQRLALPAIVAGVCPLLCGLWAAHAGHVCVGGVCSTFCVPACSASGLVAGALLGRLWRRREASLGAIFVTGLLGWSVGALGCSCAGSGGMWAMTLGLLGGAMVGRMWGRTR